MLNILAGFLSPQPGTGGMPGTEGPAALESPVLIAIGAALCILVVVLAIRSDRRGARECQRRLFEVTEPLRRAEEQRRSELARQEQADAQAEQAQRDRETRWRIEAEAREQAETERCANEFKLRLEYQRLCDEQDRYRTAQQELQMRRPVEVLCQPKNRLCTSCGLQYPISNIPVCPLCLSAAGQTEVPA